MTSVRSALPRSRGSTQDRVEVARPGGVNGDLGRPFVLVPMEMLGWKQRADVLSVARELQLHITDQFVAV